MPQSTDLSKQSNPTPQKLADYDATKEARVKIPNQGSPKWKVGGKSAQQNNTAKRKTGTKKWVSK